MTLDDLYSEVEASDIIVDNFPMRELVSAAFPENWIVLDTRKLKTSAEEKAVLAHEAGHCFTGSFYNMFSSFDFREKQEHKANAWAFKKLVPCAYLQAAVKNGLTEIWELADFFGVPCDFMHKAVEYWQQKEMI